MKAVRKRKAHVSTGNRIIISEPLANQFTDRCGGSGSSGNVVHARN
jgi:hypothetical protein